MDVWDDVVIIRYKNAKNPGSSSHLKQVAVGIPPESDKINYTKTLVVFTTPQTSINWESGKKDTNVMDLQRIEKRLTITKGYITQGLSASTAFDVGDGTGSQTYTTSATATGIKDDIANMYSAGGQVYIEYKNLNESYHIEKLEIVPSYNAGSEPSDNELGYYVTFTAVQGVDM